MLKTFCCKTPYFSNQAKRGGGYTKSLHGVKHTFLLQNSLFLHPSKAKGVYTESLHGVKHTLFAAKLPISSPE